MADLISVIIPAYNHEQYVEETVRSIIAQSYQNIELLVQDDGSKDGTFARLQALRPECEQRFSRVFFDTWENHGTVATLNRLIDLSQGKYIYLTASDDMAKPNALEILYNFLTNNQGYVLAVGDNDLINAHSQRIYWDEQRNSVPEEQARYKTFCDFLGNNIQQEQKTFGTYKKLLFTGNHIPNGYMIPKKALLESGKYNPSCFLEDWYMNLQLAKLGPFKYIPKILFSYRWHNSNTINSKAFLQKVSEMNRQIYMHERKYCLANGYIWPWTKLWFKEYSLIRILRMIKIFVKNHA